MSIVLKEEIVRLKTLMEGSKENSPEYFRYKADLEKVQKMLDDYVPASQPGANVCISCEG